MSQTISKHIGEGFGSGELYAALAYDSSDVFGGIKIKGICIDVSSASVGASTVKPIDITNTMTAAGGLGRAIQGVLNVTNVALGAWSNAIKGLIDFKTSGSVTGLGSAICAEMVMGGATMPTAGNYAPLEIELVTPEGWLGVQVASFAHMQVSGNATAMGVFETTGHLFNIVGLTADTGHMFHTVGTPTATHGLRIMIAGVGYDIMLKATGA